jgi:anti-sigma factor RsiW
VISCRTLTRLLFEFVEGSLPCEHRELVDDHLSQCAQCAALTESYRTIIHLARLLPTVSVPGPASVGPGRAQE